MKRIKIPWKKFDADGPLFYAVMTLCFTPFIMGIAISAWILMVYPIAAIWLIWNELGDDNEKT